MVTRLLYKPDEIACFKEADYITIDEIPITTGTLWTSDDENFREKNVRKTFCSYLPYVTCAHDAPSIKLEPTYTKKNGCIILSAKEPNDAIIFAFLRIFSIDKSRVRLLYIDIDEKMSHEKWIEVLPPPNLVIITPTSTHSQYIYFLDKPADLGMYWKVKKSMSALVGGDPTTPYNYKSPFFKKGDRKGVLIKRDARPADFHYVIEHDMLKPYNLQSLYEDYYNPSLETFQPKSHTIPENPTKTVNTCGRNTSMFRNGSLKAKKAYDPKLSVEGNLQTIYCVYKEFSSTLEDKEVIDTARSSLRYCQKNYDPTKHHDHSSENQRRIANYWWEKGFQENGENKVAGANRLGISLSTFKRMVRDGRLIKEGYFWKIISLKKPRVKTKSTQEELAKEKGISIRTLQRHKKKELSTHNEIKSNVVSFVGKEYNTPTLPPIKVTGQIDTTHPFNEPYDSGVEYNTNHPLIKVTGQNDTTLKEKGIETVMNDNKKALQEEFMSLNERPWKPSYARPG